MKTTPTFDQPYMLKKIDSINDALEMNNFSSWYFGYNKEEECFFLSIFDEHNPQEELIFTLEQNEFTLVSGYRYKKVKRSKIREEHIKYRQANQVLDFIADFVAKTQ